MPLSRSERRVTDRFLCILLPLTARQKRACRAVVESHAATTRHHSSERHDAQAQESVRGGFGNRRYTDIPEGRRPRVEGIQGVIYNLEIAAERAAAYASTRSKLKDGAGVAIGKELERIIAVPSQEIAQRQVNQIARIVTHYAVTTE